MQSLNSESKTKFGNDFSVVNKENKTYKNGTCTSTEKIDDNKGPFYEEYRAASELSLR